MQYEELNSQYGAYVAQRVRRELTTSEFNQIHLNDLPLWLEMRAEAAHHFYQQLLNYPFISYDTDTSRAGEACRHWRQAEDLAYLVAIGDDVGAQFLKAV